MEDNKGLMILDSCYEKVLAGVPFVSEPVEELANNYLKKYSQEKAIQEMIFWQTKKCFTSGFLTSIGGLITLPIAIAIPTNISSVLYIQMRMVAAIAYIRGYNLKDDEVKTLIYCILLDISIENILKSFGVKFANKLSLALIQKIPGKVLIEINKKLGMRFITKAGEKGLINLTKTVPFIGGVVGGSFDWITTKRIAKSACKNLTYSLLEG
ncbi:EcsC family protein [Fusobacterium polymorphum]|uniref:EcsC family protein n=1 Tax=Fusobacterium nucleatum subsp. polymorphum TaxID=76857 RepID=UPI00300BF5CC